MVLRLHPVSRAIGRRQMSNTPNVPDHYGATDLRRQVRQALEQSGLRPGSSGWKNIASLDQFHARGLAATEDLAAGMGLIAGETVIDIGCGLGGSSRYLAATFGCHVAGIDLSQPFVDVARMLAELVGLEDAVDYRQGSALDLPFGDATFDHAWTQHVAMNIADRGRLYSEIRRVMKPNGRFAIYDAVAGKGEAPIYPVPWARSAETSFLLRRKTWRRSWFNPGLPRFPGTM